MLLTLSDGEVIGIEHAGQLPALLAGIEDGGFAILERGPGHYAQAALDQGRWHIEQRSGGAETHVVATRSTASAGPPPGWLKRLFAPPPRHEFARGDVERVLSAWLAGAPMPADMSWRKLY